VAQDVFISYARKDQEFVRALQSALSDADLTAWVDWEDIAPSAEWMSEIEGAIESSDNFLFVVSPDSVASPTCRREAEHADEHRKRVVPVVRRDVNADLVPEPVRARNWIFCRESDDFGSAVEVIGDTLRTDLDWVRDHTRLVVRAVEWDGHGRNRSFLLRGDDLDAAEAWERRATERATPAPTPLQLDYIAASRQSATRSSRLRLAAVSVALVVAIVLSIVALLQRNEAQHQATVADAQARNALSRSLAFEARGQVDTDPGLAQLLAAQSRRLDDTRESRATLLEVVNHEPALRRTTALGDPGDSIVAFTRNGRFAVTRSDAGVARVWDVANLRQVGRPYRLAHADDYVSLSPDGTRFVDSRPPDSSLPAEGTVVDVGTGAVIARTGVVIGAWMISGSRLATIAEERLVASETGFFTAYTLKVVDLASGQAVDTPGAKFTVPVSAAFAPVTSNDGGSVALVDETSMAVRVVDTATGQDRVSPLAVGFIANLLAVNADGTRVAVFDGGSLKVRDTATGEVLMDLAGDLDWAGLVNGSFNGSGSLLTFRNGADSVLVVDVLSGRTLQIMSTGGEPSFAGDSDTVLVPHGRILEQYQFAVPPGPQGSYVGEDRGIRARVSPDRRWLAARAAAFPFVSADLPWSAMWTRRLGLVPLAGHARRSGITPPDDRGFTAFAFRADADELVTSDFNPTDASAGSTIRRWDTNTGQPVGQAVAVEGVPIAVAISPGSSEVAALVQPAIGNASGPRLIRWRTRDGGVTSELDVGDQLTGIFDPAARRLATVTPNGSITLWDAVHAKRLAASSPSATGGVLTDGGFTPDGRRLYTVQDYPSNELVLWDATDLREVARLSEPLSSYFGVTNDGGSALLVGSRGSVELRDLRSGRTTQIAAGGYGKAAGYGPTVSGDGALVATVGESGLIIAGPGLAGSGPSGSAALGGLALRFGLSVSASEPRPPPLFFDRTNSHLYLLTPGALDEVTAYAVDADTAQRQACAVAGRNLTRAEWRRYLPGREYERTCP
jgi:WD40 repeat protein